jgi:hypothetical protein
MIFAEQARHKPPNLIPGQDCIRQKVYQIKTRLPLVSKLENERYYHQQARGLDQLVTGRRRPVFLGGRGGEFTEE